MNNKYIAVLICSLGLAACEADKGETLQTSLNQGNTVDVINDLNFGDSVLPFPNNILFAGTGDGTLNIPVVDANDLADPQVALNALDGFSTSAPITTGFSGALDDTSLPAGVKMYEATFNAGLGVVTSVDAALTYGVDYAASQSINTDGTVTLAIVPLKPLKPKQTYMAVITDDLKSASGKPAGISGSYALTHGSNPLEVGGVSTTPLLSDAQAVQLEQIRLATVQAETVLNTFDGTASADIILSWNFTTQSIDDVLAQVRLDVRALGANAGFAPTVVDDTPGGAATIHVGTLDVPYYLTRSTGADDDTALGSYWQGPGGSNVTQYNLSPVSTSIETIPMIVTIPKSIGNCVAGMPVDGWPVVIYQHGITRKRADVAAVADSLAAACLAVVAIDLPMHGVTGLETDGSAPFKDLPVAERHFDLDLVTQDASGNITDAMPDMVIDSSGIHFINLTNLLNTRDNVRQAVSDLFALVDAINEDEITDGANMMDEQKIYFLGHSLGAIVGTTFLALESDVDAAVLANGGSGIAKILDGSASFGPTIAAGLAANGVVKGTADYEAFLVAAQTMIDSADPVNYSLDAPDYAPSAAANRGVLFTVIVGDAVLGKPSDLTVPISVPDANDTTGTVPSLLAGSNPQVSLLGLDLFNSSQAGADLAAVTRFTSGYHGSLIDPAADPLADSAVTFEMQGQIASFLASDGAVLTVTNAGVLLAP